VLESARFKPGENRSWSMNRILMAATGAAVLAMTVLLVACGGSGNGNDTASKAAKLPKNAAITLGCHTMTGYVYSGAKIYLRVNEPERNETVHAVEAVADYHGIVAFDQLPEGDFILHFTDEQNRPCSHRVDLREFTGENAGNSIGDCVF